MQKQPLSSGCFCKNPMNKVSGKKLKMTQTFDNDRAIAVTPIKLENGADLEFVKKGDLVKVSGITKGKGFQGVVKRHGFAGGPKTHGQKNRHRAPGSIGNTAAQRVLPGRRMPGRMGGGRATIKNLLVVNVDKEQKLVFLKGAVPGNNSGKIEIRK